MQEDCYISPQYFFVLLSGPYIGGKCRLFFKGGHKFETTHEVAAKERHRKKPSKKDGEKRREEKLRGRKRVVSENKAATAQKGKALRHGKGFRGR